MCIRDRVYIRLNEAKIEKNSVENRLKKNMFKTIKNVINVFFVLNVILFFFGCLKRVLNMFKTKNVFFIPTLETNKPTKVRPVGCGLYPKAKIFIFELTRADSIL